MKTIRSNLTGQKIGKLTVIEFSHIAEKGKHAIWLCHCDCGNNCYVRSGILNAKQRKSCGCIKKVLRDKNKSWTGYGEISGNFWNHLKSSAEARSIPLQLTIKEAWELFLAQDRKCALTGLPLTFDSRYKACDGCASLDRIDSSKGYVMGNVQWVHKTINMMKWKLSTAEFLNMVKLVYNFTAVLTV